MSSREKTDDDGTVCNKGLQLTLINTNARSLCPKINSLIDCFDETGASVGVVTETWLSDGWDLEEDVDDLMAGSGLGMLYRNRPKNGKGFSHMEVWLFFSRSPLSLIHI